MTKRGKGKAHKRPNRKGPAKANAANRSSTKKKFAGPRPDRGTYSQDDDLRGKGDTGSGLAKARQETDRQISAWLKHDPQREAKPLDAFALDPWQQEVLDALNAGYSVIVDAPTTAGKTRAVEAFFRANLANPLFRAAYTTPVKSLSNDKLREFREMFGAERVGIATGDIKENLGAPVVVATLESYRNSLLGVEPDLGRTLVVFDEYHYLQDESRGSAWEEALILTPKSCQLLLLSASVANADEFSAWLSKIHPERECRLIRTETRPVPLVPLVFYGGQWLLPDTVPGGVMRGLDRSRMQVPLRQETLAERAAQLIPIGITPTIIYVGRRLAAETMAMLLCRHLQPLPEQQATLIGESLETSQKEFKALSFISPKLRQMLQVYGVGFHHSGLAAPARMAIERLVKMGLLRFCCATMGLSLGINFSVRSALIGDYQRPGELGFKDYRPSEVLQMLGRAGRRGKDKVGFSLWPSPESFARLGQAKRDAVQSRLRTDPTTFLGLIGRGFSLRAIETFYGKSFRRHVSPATDLTLLTKSRLVKKLGSELPCDSPAAEMARFRRKDSTALCFSCRHQAKCHEILDAKTQGDLSALHLHLHALGALNADESLSDFGAVARYFPQAGGLVMARLIASGRIHQDNLTKAAELAAALGLARFKDPGGEPGYRLPFDEAEIEGMLEDTYPFSLFPEVYDTTSQRRSRPVIREFNPKAGYAVKEWLHGMPWKDLVQSVTGEAFGTGDLMSLLYRTGTYLQSMVQARPSDISSAAKSVREALLREPLSYVLEI